MKQEVYRNERSVILREDKRQAMVMRDDKRVRLEGEQRLRHGDKQVEQ